MDRPTYLCECMETVYVDARARHEAKDHLSPEDERDIALVAFSVSLTDAQMRRYRRVARRVFEFEGDPGDAILVDQFGDEFRLREVIEVRRDMGLEAWSLLG